MPRTGRTAFALLAALLASCSLSGTGVDGDEGSIAITLFDATAKTLLPPIDMSPASFDIAGTGPGGRTFSQSTSSWSVVVNKLAFGTWSVTVSARNAGGEAIGRGSGTATVVTGQQTPLAITVTPIAGTGAFDLRVAWTAADVQAPSIDAQLLPSSGPAIVLACTLASGSAGCLKAGIPNGYYTLLLKLLDNGVLVMGAAEVVRIVAGQTTPGTFDFTRIDSGVGSVAISITLRNGFTVN